jgi:hypothetical protein
MVLIVSTSEGLRMAFGTLAQLETIIVKYKLSGYIIIEGNIKKGWCPTWNVDNLLKKV